LFLHLRPYQYGDTRSLLLPSPNALKVALYLQEASLHYDLIPIDTSKGEHHSPAFMAIKPNAETPALVDGDAVVFDRNAILLFLAEKTGPFAPANRPTERSLMYSRLMFVATGIDPECGKVNVRLP